MGKEGTLSKMDPCPSCGAVWEDGQDCQQRFDECLALEFSHPTFGAVHHLTVPAFMLQHSGKLTTEGAQAMLDILHLFLVKHASPSHVRATYSGILDNKQRGWKFTKTSSAVLIDSNIWTCTISSVTMESGEKYCETIKDWAWSVYRDGAAAMPTLNKEKK